jgi:hypothetical protein
MACSLVGLHGSEAQAFQQVIDLFLVGDDVAAAAGR